MSDINDGFMRLNMDDIEIIGVENSFLESLVDAFNEGREIALGPEIAEVPYIERIHTKVLAAIKEHINKFDMTKWVCGEEKNPLLIFTDPECNSTMCHAGFTVASAGQKGYDLVCSFDENKEFDELNISIAAGLIYYRSTGRVPDFYCTNDEAIADLEYRAALENAK